MSTRDIIHYRSEWGDTIVEAVDVPNGYTRYKVSHYTRKKVDNGGDGYELVGGQEREYMSQQRQ